MFNGALVRSFHVEEAMKQTTPAPALEPLAVLVGEWEIGAAFPPSTEIVPGGRVTFEWLTGGHFLVERWEVDYPDAPDGIQIIGRDAGSDDFTAHYFDSRGIARVYQMSLGDGVWKIWRNVPGFSQRFAGTLSDDGMTISGAWEISLDDATWDHDFDLIYRKIS
jgi:hypothetical protein